MTKGELKDRKKTNGLKEWTASRTGTDHVWGCLQRGRATGSMRVDAVAGVTRSLITLTNHDECQGGASSPPPPPPLSPAFYNVIICTGFPLPKLCGLGTKGTKKHRS